jgi:hypothetical protein
MSDDVSNNQDKAMQALKNPVKEVVHAIKYNHDYAAACALITKYNLSFDTLIHSTVKLSTEDLANLADKLISQK